MYIEQVSIQATHQPHSVPLTDKSFGHVCASCVVYEQPRFIPYTFPNHAIQSRRFKILFRKKNPNGTLGILFTLFFGYKKSFIQIIEIFLLQGKKYFHYTRTLLYMSSFDWTEAKKTALKAEISGFGLN